MEAIELTLAAFGQQTGGDARLRSAEPETRVRVAARMKFRFLSGNNDGCRLI
jgi:hypothetical protein